MTSLKDNPRVTALLVWGVAATSLCRPSALSSTPRAGRFEDGPSTSAGSFWPSLGWGRGLHAIPQIRVLTPYPPPQRLRMWLCLEVGP